MFLDGLLGDLKESRNGLSGIELVALIIRIRKTIVLRPSLQRSIPLLSQQKPRQFSLQLLADELRPVQHSLYCLFFEH